MIIRRSVLLAPALLMGCSLLSPQQRSVMIPPAPASQPSQTGRYNEALQPAASSAANQQGAANSVIDYAVAGVGGFTLLLIITALMSLNYKSKALDLRADELREMTFILLLALQHPDQLPPVFWDGLRQRMAAAR